MCRLDFVARLIKDMEYNAERRKRRKRCVAGGGGGSPGKENDGHIGSVSVGEQGEREPEDPFSKVARKIRSVKDQILVGVGLLAPSGTGRVTQLT